MIYFRSKKYQTLATGFSHHSLPLNGTDWREIGPYQYGDTRDIIWNKIQGDTLFKKTRQEFARLNITLYLSSSPGDVYYDIYPSDSRMNAKNMIKYHIENSIKLTSSSYKNLSGIEIGELKKKISQEEIKNSLFFVICSYEDVRLFIDGLKFSHLMNDIVFIIVLHPQELHPKKLIVDGKILRQELYTSLFLKERKDIKNLILKNGMESVEIGTEEDSLMKLNFFFKNRILYG